MKKAYSIALDSLIDIVQKSRDKIYENHGRFEKSMGALIFLGDSRFGTYSSIVSANEYRASKVIESLAVTLFSEQNKSNYILYPVDSAYERAPFKIIITEGKTKIGVAFSNLNDASEYYKPFIDGNYKVDKLKLVIINDPDDLSREANFSLVNKVNVDSGIQIERVPILDFWTEYFGDDECNNLCEFCNQFNEKAKSIIGFNTVVTPTEKALNQFRDSIGNDILSRTYAENIPDSIYETQVSTMLRNYLARGLWRAMIGTSTFATSFVTSEWFYKMYQLTENLDLTAIVTGYLKSIEQLLFEIVLLSEGTGITIKSKGKDIVLFDKENIDNIDITLGALEQVINHNPRLLDVNRYAKEHLLDAIDDWRSKQRNGYFHKDNIHDMNKVNEIREKAFQLYFLILGCCTIGDDQFDKLGIN